jgi:signal transduction histidine kinase
LVDTTPIVLYRIEEQADFAGPRRIGSALSEAIGFKAANFLNNPQLWPSCIHPEDRPRVLSRVAALGENESFALEYRLQCADDSERIFLDRGIAGAGPDGMVEIHGSCMDVTEQRRLERRLLWSQRLESMGLVIDDLAHDFLNMLSVTIWNLDGMMRSIEANNVKGRDRDRVVAALTGANNGAGLFKELMQFAKRLPPKIKARWIEPTALLKRIEKMVRLLVGDQAVLEVSLADDLWPITADEAQIESMLVALVLLARDGVAKTGVLRIQGSNETRTESTADLAAGDYLVLTISGGDGKPREGEQKSVGRAVIPKDAIITNPLHLSLIENLAKQWGGQLMVVGVNRPGSAIKLMLPRTRATSSTQ